MKVIEYLQHIDFINKEICNKEFNKSEAIDKILMMLILDKQEDRVKDDIENKTIKIDLDGDYECNISYKEKIYPNYLMPQYNKKKIILLEAKLDIKSLS